MDVLICVGNTSADVSGLTQRKYKFTIFYLENTMQSILKRLKLSTKYIFIYICI